MRAVPLDLKRANHLVEQWHRHHKSTWGYKFSIGAVQGKRLIGAVICGRPVARMIDQESVIEVTRLVTDGTKNACSFLYQSAARAAKAMGFWKIQTYILDSEPGTSLRAAGWEFSAKTSGGTWNRPNREREDKHPIQAKQRWERVLNDPFNLDEIDPLVSQGEAVEEWY